MAGVLRAVTKFHESVSHRGSDAEVRGEVMASHTKNQLQILVDEAEYHGGSFKKMSKLAHNGVDPETTDPRHIPRDLYCIVLPAKATHKKPYKTDEDVTKFRQALVNSLVEAGLGASLFYSIQGDEVFVKVSATDERLLLEADLCEHVLELDANSMRTVAASSADLPQRAPIYLEPPFDPKGDFAYRSQFPSITKSLGLSDEDDQWIKIEGKDVPGYLDFTTDPFAHLHARYNDNWERHHLEKNKVEIYKTYGDGSILRTADRLRLVQIIMERSRHPDATHGNKGAGLNLQLGVIKKQFLAAYPYTPATTIPPGELGPLELYDKWIRWDKLPWVQPLDHIRDYFGEAVAIYFAFLGHYMKWLFFAGVVGFAVFVHQLVNIQDGTGKANFFSSTTIDHQKNKTIAWSEVPETSFFALFIAFWSTFMIEYWKRKQARLALRWGMSDFEAVEVVRPEFVATHKLPSQITGKAELYYSPTTLRLKIQASLGIILGCMVVVVACIAGIFIFKVAISQAGSSIDPENATYIALVVNVVAIQSLAAVYKMIAKALNDWENYRTDTAYTDALIVKTFIFSCCNSYATLFYMAYVRSGLVILGQLQACEMSSVDHNKQVYPDACFGNIGVSLLIVFVLAIVLNNSLEVGIPSIKGLVKAILNTRIKTSPSEHERVILRSPAEDAFYLESYEGTFGDFLEMAIQFGYVTLFVAAFPLAPFLAFVNNVIEVRVDSFKVCVLSRRTHNVGAQDIGSWQGCFAFLATASVLSNAAVIFFTSKSLISVPPEVTISRDAFLVWMWVLSSALVLGVKYIIDVATPDVPADVTLQLQRQEYLVRKCLAMEPDSDPEETEAEKAAQSRQAADAKFVIMEHDPYLSAVMQAVAKAILSDSNFDAEAAFKAADKNHNGNIDKREFAALLKKVGGVAAKVTAGELEMIAQSLDRDRSGNISYQEFLTLVKKVEV